MFDTLLKIANKFIPDKDSAAKLAREMEGEYTKQMEMKSQIIQEEARNGSGLWRVRLMYLCMFIVTSQYIMYDVIPWFSAVFEWEYIIPRIAPVHADLWSFLKIGVGGYIGSRGVEKSIAHFRRK